MKPANNALEQTAPRGRAVARSADVPRAHSRTGAAAQRERSADEMKRASPFAVFVVTVLLLAAGHHSGWAQSRPNRDAALSHFCCGALRDLEPADRAQLADTLTRLPGFRPSGGPHDPYVPTHLLDASVGPDAKFILFEQPRVLPVPAADVVRIQLLADSRCVGAFEASVGWRQYIASIAVRASRLAKAPLLEIGMRGDGDGDGYHSIAREFFAVTPSGLRLVRLENATGEPIRNRYHYPNYTIGPFGPAWTDDERLRALASADAYEVLETLLWLGGIHSPPRPPTETTSPSPLPTLLSESVGEAEQVARLRSDSHVVARLRSLADSGERWLHEAAQNALTPVIEERE